MRWIGVLAIALFAAGCGEAGVEPADAVEPEATVEDNMGAILQALPLAPDLSAFERTVGERMRAIAASMVEVDMLSGDDIVGHGSGVFVSADGDVLTAAHVVDDRAHHFRVLLPDGSTREGAVAAIDEAHDAALLHTRGATTAFARASDRGARAGDWVVCAGYGGDVSGDKVPMRTAGLVADSAYTWSVTEYRDDRRWPVALKTTIHANMLRTDCGTAPGMSGGPVVDLRGELVGLVVGGGGVVTSLRMVPHLLATAPPHPQAAHEPIEVGVDVARIDGVASRYATLEPLIIKRDAERSVIDLELATPGDADEHFAGVIVSSDGLVVAPAGRLTESVEPGAAIAAEDIRVANHPDARCESIVAVRGELALLRFSGLVSTKGAEGDLRAIGAAGAAAAGEIVAAVGSDGRQSIGFVTSIDRHPGSVARDTPRWGCGTMRMRFRRDNRAIVVRSAMAHDADTAGAGSLLVDRRGRPVAIEVASRATGLAFAVPWSEVMARFADTTSAP